jgi:hypothetical protein
MHCELLEATKINYLRYGCIPNIFNYTFQGFTAICITDFFIQLVCYAGPHNKITYFT